MTNQFISVIVYEDSCNIKQKIIKNSKLIHKEEFNFDIKSKDALGAKVIGFINELQEKYDNTYIALFLNSLGQGIIPGCDETLLDRFNIDKSAVKTICKDNRFLMYATNIDIKWADKLFAKTGLDFLFSPFLVLDFFIKGVMKKESFNKDDVVIYILYTKNSLTLMIQRDSELLYGAFFNTAKEENPLYTDYEEMIESSEEIDELDLDSIDELEMDDIIDAANQTNFVTNILENREVLSEQDERIVKYINASLKEFYSNDIYKSDFITSAMIFDDVGMSDGVLKYIENELLLNTTAQNISVSDAILNLSIAEALETDV
jgi:hypothetical protein